MDFSVNEKEFSSFIKALRFAAVKHREQQRKGKSKTPYINHPIEVCEILWETGKVRDINTLVAALLHDTVEDTDASPELIEQLFGAEVRELVQELTDDKSQPKEERKRLQVEHAPHMSPQAKLIKLADKISNVREIAQDPPVDWSLERRKAYLEWGKQVVAGLRGQNQALETLFDEVYVQGYQTVKDTQIN